MLEKGVPVVFAHIADIHDNRSGSGTFGPGQAGYVAQASAYNKAFGQFFTRLKTDGIDQSNTLFVVVPDERDHFAGAAPSPANCDGVTTSCTYSQIGELNLNLAAATANAGDSTPFDIHFDDAPTVYVAGQPGPADPTVRQLERTMAGLTAADAYAGTSPVNLMVAMADPIEEQMLHMVTADPARTPTFTFFGNPDYFFTTTGSASRTVGPGFAWNHGDIQPEIARTFVGIVGPGVAHLGQDGKFFSDHTDVRPTIMQLVGLQDDYVHDGRVMTEVLNPKTLSKSLKTNAKLLQKLGQAYKEINAPFGALASASLTFSTKAIMSTSTNDQTYLHATNQIKSWIEQRDSIANEMKSMLEGAEFGNHPIDGSDAQELIRAADSLTQQAQKAARAM